MDLSIPIVCDVVATMSLDDSKFEVNVPFVIVSPLINNSYDFIYMNIIPLPPAPPRVVEPKPPPPPPPP